jgi:hypothetical protein
MAPGVALRVFPRQNGQLGSTLAVLRVGERRHPSFLVRRRDADVSGYTSRSANAARSGGGGVIRRGKPPKSSLGLPQALDLQLQAAVSAKAVQDWPKDAVDAITLRDRLARLSEGDGLVTSMLVA